MIWERLDDGKSSCATYSAKVPGGTLYRTEIWDMVFSTCSQTMCFVPDSGIEYRYKPGDPTRDEDE